jgi:hypothetical protein
MDSSERDELPPELRAFLYSCIDAVEQVEILMLLQRTDRPWNVRDVAQSLAMTERAARIHLETLTARGLLTARPGAEVTYRYEPKSADLARYAAALAEAFAASRSAVHRFVALHSRRARSFADAFRLREPREPED